MTRLYDGDPSHMLRMTVLVKGIILHSALNTVGSAFFVFCALTPVRNPQHMPLSPHRSPTDCVSGFSAKTEPFRTPKKAKISPVVKLHKKVACLMCKRLKKFPLVAFSSGKWYDYPVQLLANNNQIVLNFKGGYTMANTTKSCLAC